MVAVCELAAQTPVLSNIESPYATIQSPVTIAGSTYGAGSVTYGPVGTPLVLTGTNFGSTATVEFIGYKNGAVDAAATPVQVQVQPFSSMISVDVPTGTVSGLVKVIVGGITSNGLPFIVTPGSYSGSCPAAPTSSQLQITTGSLSQGLVGQSYSATLSATGGSGSYSWALASGTLPAGLSLSSAGVLSGTPTAAAGPIDLTIRVTDTSSPQQSDQAVFSLTIGAQTLVTGTIYQYAASYDGVGNVSSSNDTVNGTFSSSYDTLNRLSLSTWTPQGAAAQYLCWQYDSFGNRLQQEQSSAAFSYGGGTNACVAQSNASLTTVLTSVNSNNQINNTNARGVADIPTYDGAGNILSDGVANYVYDLEGRICAVEYTAMPGITSRVGYLYDADGNRITKGKITSMSCDPVTANFQLTASYVLGQGGEELTTSDGNGNWQRTNVYAAGKLLATYDTAGLHFHIADPLGTRRVQASGNNLTLGQPEIDYQNLPYGDDFATRPDPNAVLGSADSTPLFFTGKERDSESGNDYFGARYYANSMGRFMSPDWSAKASPVPYATFTNPQSLNLYSYMRNNPLSGADADGHCDISCIFSMATTIAQGVLRDGSVGAYLKNVGTGIIKGAATTIGNTATIAASGANPGVIASTITSPGPAALQPSNTTQAQASMVTQAVLPAAAGVAAGPLLGAAAGAGAEAESGVGVGTQLFRVFGNEATPFGNPNGAFFTTMDPSTAVPDFRTAAGLFPGNSGQFVMTGTLNDMTGVTSGTAAAGPGGVGGTIPEVIVPNAAQQVTPTSVSGANPPY